MRTSWRWLRGALTGSKAPTRIVRLAPSVLVAYEVACLLLLNGRPFAEVVALAPVTSAALVPIDRAWGRFCRRSVGRRERRLLEWISTWGRRLSSIAAGMTVVAALVLATVLLGNEAFGHGWLPFPLAIGAFSVVVSPIPLSFAVVLLELVDCLYTPWRLPPRHVPVTDLNPALIRRWLR